TPTTSLPDRRQARPPDPTARGQQPRSSPQPDPTPRPRRPRPAPTSATTPDKPPAARPAASRPPPSPTPPPPPPPPPPPHHPHPPFPSPQPRPLLVIIDLNGTLIHRPSRRSNPTNFHPRPHASPFLHYVITTFTTMIWSSAKPENVRSVTDRLLTPSDRAGLV